MCTDYQFERLITTYNNYCKKVAELDAIKKELAADIMAELDARGEDSYNGVRLITEQLRETVTKDGKQALKDMYSGDIDRYIKVSYMRFVDSRKTKKIG